MAARQCFDRGDGGFYRCEECSKGFNRMASYEAHIRMHAQDELDIYDVVFNYTGRLHEIPSGRAKRRAKPRPRKPNSSPQQKSSVLQQKCDDNPALTIRQLLQVNPSVDEPLCDTAPPAAHHAVGSQPTSVLGTGANPPQAPSSKEDIPKVDGGSGTTTSVGPQSVTDCSRSLEAASCSNICSISNPVAQLRPEVITISSSESEAESLVVKVPFKVCSAEVLRNPVITLTKQDCSVLSGGSNVQHESTSSLGQGIALQPVESPLGVQVKGEKTTVINSTTVTPPKKVPKVIRLDSMDMPTPPKAKKMLCDASGVKTKGALKSKGAPRFQCLVCDRWLSNYNSLKRHTLLHTGERPFKCSFCSKTYIQSHHLQKHELGHRYPIKRPKGSVSSSVSGSSPESEYSCGVCNMTFSGQRHLQYHLTMHDTSRPFKCNVCGMRFLKKGHLDYHMQTHTEKRYACHYCNKKFNRSQYLDQHMLVHLREDTYTNSVTGEVKYMCKYCPKVCRSLSGLTRHQAIHIKHTKPKNEDGEDGEIVRGGLETESDSMGVADTETEGELADVSEGGATEESMDETNLSKTGGIFGSKVLELPEKKDSNPRVEESDESEGGEMSPLQLDSEENDSTDEEEGSSGDFRRFVQCSGDMGRSDSSCGSSGVGIPYRNPHNHQKGSGAKPQYKCEWCGRMFIKRNYLRQHYILHQQVPHQCDICGKVFMSLRYLKRHLRSKHDRC